jgi:hypothetical protein
MDDPSAPGSPTLPHDYDDELFARRPRGGRKDRSERQIESEEKSMNQDDRPSAPPTPPDADDDPSSRRPRGGRKDRSKQQIESEEKKMNQRLNQRLNERLRVKRAGRFQTSKDDADEQGQPDERDGREWQDEQDEQDEGYPEEATTERHQRSKPRAQVTDDEAAERTSHRKRPDTGVRAFNIRKADPEGGKPVGFPRATVREKRPSEGSERWSRDRATSSPEREGREGREGRRETGERRESDERKDVSIRIDLNLEVELLLKTKIKGDLTITFL